MLPVSRPSLPPLPDFERLLEDIWSTHMLSNFGKYARRFEGVAQEYLANPWVRCVVNGDIGLVLSLAALEIPEGSECLVQSFTFNSTVNAVLWNRLRPVFVDIDPKTFNVDVWDLERRIGPHTRAVVVTHIFGSPLDLDRVLELARGRGIPVVVDAAHGYGAAYRGIRIGDPRLGDYQVFSLSGMPVLDVLTGKTDMFVLQLQIGSVSADSFLGWYNPASMTWVNAVEGNIGGTNRFGGVGAYDAATDFQLGTWGVDVVGGKVWAVLNHNSDFAISSLTAVPEPSACAAGMVVLLGILVVRRAFSKTRPA